MNNKHLPLVEALAVPDVYVSGLADVEPLGGGVYRFTFYALQRSAITGHTERVVVAKNICMAETARTICALSLDIIEDTGCRIEQIPEGVTAH